MDAEAQAQAQAEELERLRNALECIEENDDSWARDFARQVLAQAGQEGGAL